MELVRTTLKHKLTQFVLILILAFIFLRFGIPLLSLALTGTPAPIGAHLLWTIYMPIVALVMLLFVSVNETGWNEFREPLYKLLVEEDDRRTVALRRVLLVTLPLLGGVITYLMIQSQVSSPAELRSIHPADPGTINVGGEQFVLQGLRNPLRDEDGSVSQSDLNAGQAIYVTNCIFCHGDALNGKGMFASGLRPIPANFTDSGTIAQLSESYVFWRVAKGGIGLPDEGTPWNSAMPAWDDELTPTEIWQVIAYLYEGAGSNIFPAERTTE